MPRTALRAPGASTSASPSASGGTRCSPAPPSGPRPAQPGSQAAVPPGPPPRPPPPRRPTRLSCGSRPWTGTPKASADVTTEQPASHWGWFCTSERRPLGGTQTGHVLLEAGAQPATADHGEALTGAVHPLAPQHQPPAGHDPTAERQPQPLSLLGSLGKREQSTRK